MGNPYNRPPFANGPVPLAVPNPMTGSRPPPPMAAKLNRYNPLRLFQSVPFGILLMVTIAGYLAIGSGRPWLRSTGLDQVPGFREWFDKTDLEFFNSWPLKTLMALLVVNLMVVTWRKIPLTPPRYGVWCIHAGIITLILGASIHYSRKVEGRVRLFADPSVGPATVDSYYDKDERALYVRTGRDTPAMFPLPTLPRFQQYSEADGTAESLTRRAGLHDLRPAVTAVNQDNQRVAINVAEMVYPPNEKPAAAMTVDVVGYYPYATVSTSFDQTDPASHVTGVELSMGDPADPRTAMDWYVVGSDPRYATDTQHLMDIAQVSGEPNVTASVATAAEQLFHLDVTTAGGKVPTSTYVKIGQTLDVDGYAVKVIRHDPSWSLFGTGQPAKMLEMMVTTPARQTFRRMVLEGKPTQTDFVLGAADAGPMGKRQKEPLDKGLVIAFRVEDPFHLLPGENAVKHTLLTPTGSTELTDVEASYDAPAVVRHHPDGKGEIALAMPAAEMPPGAEAEAHGAIHVQIERHDHLKPVDSVRVVPPNRRDENADENGDFQVAKLRVRLGDWSREVVVPFSPAAGEKLRQDGWRGGYVQLPGAIAPLQFQLGNTRRPLPVAMTLKEFRAVPYAGAADGPNAMYRDYRSTVTLGGADDETMTETASLNQPIYFDGGRWLFFQASYDPNLPHTWTMLGVGNRPAVRVMFTGCVMIVVGLMYAFYAKPVIIRRMKERALAAHAGRPKPTAAVPRPVEELVGTA